MPLEIRLKFLLHIVNYFNIVLNGLVIFLMLKLESVLDFVGLHLTHVKDSELFFCLIWVKLITRPIMFRGQSVGYLTRNCRLNFEVY